MKDAVKPRRTYRSPRRDAQASATRRAILDAARDLFIKGGYVGTTMQALAEHAGVSPATVYATFVTKRAVLSALVDISIAGDDAPVAILDRPWVAQLREEPDLGRRIGLLAHHGRLMLERRAAVDEVLRAAATADGEIATMWQQAKAQRFMGQKVLLGIVAGPSLRLTGEAVDALYAIGSPETYGLLVRDRGWSPARFERWYATSIRELIGSGSR
jgi:TetR/AcrR family transcriptional regulator, regulator of autoinduction and epiphytic fitness